MANLGVQNKNPGNIKDPSTGQFKVFATPEEGHQALIDDIKIKQSGRSSHIQPGASLSDFAKVWAPASDNNNPDDWANNVAKFLGVDTAYAFDKIPAEKLAEGIKVAEGTTSLGSSSSGGRNSNSQSHLSHAQMVENINALEKQGAQPDEIQAYLNNLPKEQQGGVSMFSDAVGQMNGGEQPTQKTGTEKTESLLSPFAGHKIGEGIGTLATRIKAREGNTGAVEADYSRLSPEAIARLEEKGVPTTVDEQRKETAGTIKGPSALDLTKDTGKVALQIGGAKLAGGLISKLLPKAGTALESPVVKNVLTNFLGPGEDLAKLKTAEKLDILTEASKSASPSEKTLIGKAIQEAGQLLFKEQGIKPEVVKKTGGLIGKLINAGLTYSVLKSILGKDTADVVGKVKGVFGKITE